MNALDGNNMSQTTNGAELEMLRKYEFELKDAGYKYMLRYSPLHSTEERKFNDLLEEKEFKKKIHRIAIDLQKQYSEPRKYRQGLEIIKKSIIEEMKMDLKNRSGDELIHGISRTYWRNMTEAKNYAVFAINYLQGRGFKYVLPRNIDACFDPQKELKK